MSKTICIGDSLTFGYGVNTNEPWVSLLKSSFHETIIINRGVNGDTSSGVLSRFYNHVIEEHADKVIITIGSNDFLMGLSVDYVLDNLKLLIKESLENSIKPIVGIEPMIDGELAKEYWCSYLDYSVINSKISLYHKKVLDYCNDKDIPIVDFYDLFLDIKDAKNLISIFIDGLHPNKEIHKLMAEKVITTLKKI